VRLGVCKCFGCGRASDYIGFIKNFHRVSFIEAIRLALATKPITYPKSSSQFEFDFPWELPTGVITDPILRNQLRRYKSAQRKLSLNPRSDEPYNRNKAQRLPNDVDNNLPF